MKRLDDKKYELIDKYLNGTLPDEEAVDFEIQMSLDKELEEEVKLRLLMHEAIRFRRKEYLKFYIQRNSRMNLSGTIWGKTFTRFSAFIILFVGILYFVMQPEPDEEFRYTPSKPAEEEVDTLNTEN
jgi:hypothetical protein